MALVDSQNNQLVAPRVLREENDLPVPSIRNTKYLPRVKQTLSPLSPIHVDEVESVLFLIPNVHVEMIFVRIHVWVASPP